MGPNSVDYSKADAFTCPTANVVVASEEENELDQLVNDLLNASSSASSASAVNTPYPYRYRMKGDDNDDDQQLLPGFGHYLPKPLTAYKEGESRIIEYKKGRGGKKDR